MPVRLLPLRFCFFDLLSIATGRLSASFDADDATCLWRRSDMVDWYLGVSSEIHLGKGNGGVFSFLGMRENFRVLRRFGHGCDGCFMLIWLLFTVSLL